MARVRLIHWNGPEGRERAARLAALGHEAEFHTAEGAALLRPLRAHPPDAIVIDLSRLPSHGREIALALRSSKSTRYVPLVFVDGDAEKVERLRRLLPDATYTSWGRLRTALAKAISRPAVAPIVVPSTALYSGRSLAQKLGLKPGMTVAIHGAPSGFGERLAAPPGSRLTATIGKTCDMALVFVRSQQELSLQFGRLASLLTTQTVWCIWPKLASKIATDLTGNVVRETGLALGWVDFKVCAVDDIWSALAFKRRA